MFPDVLISFKELVFVRLVCIYKLSSPKSFQSNIFAFLFSSAPALPADFLNYFLSYPLIMASSRQAPTPTDVHSELMNEFVCNLTATQLLWILQRIQQLCLHVRP
jgi:hypothetical protein